MNINELKQQINRVIGVKGDLRIQAWWMNKILNDILVYCDETGNNSVSDELILNAIARIDNIPAFPGTGTGSLLQTKEVETFENNNTNASITDKEITVDALGDNAVVLNGKSHAGAKRSLAHGNGTIALGENSHTEGTETITEGINSHAEGERTIASGHNSHAEGYNTSAEGENSHAEGYQTKAKGKNSHTEGMSTTALGLGSHAEGYCTKTNPNIRAQHVEGYYNYVETDAIKVIGCGTDDQRCNAVEVCHDGKVFVKNVGGFNGQSRQTDNPADLATIIESLTPYYTSFNISDLESWVGLSAQPIQEQGLQNAILNKRSIRIPFDTDENKGYVTCISCEINDLIYLKAFYTNNLYSIDIDLTGSEVTVNSNSLF